MDALRSALPFLLEGAEVTLVLSAVSLAVGLVLGILAALARLSRFRPLRVFAQAYVDIIRGTPLLVQLFLIYYGLPELGIQIDAFPAAVIGLGMNYGAYLAEVFRGGLLSVDRGQWEAARSLGMRPGPMIRSIILPQAVRVALPGVGNYAISMLKDTALASTVTVNELLRQAQLQVAISFNSFQIYLVVAAMYLIMSFPLTLVVKRLERWSARGFA